MRERKKLIAIVESVQYALKNDMDIRDLLTNSEIKLLINYLLK